MLPIAEEMLDDSDKGERKRQREKQRRSDLASAFEELQMALSRIEHGCDAYGRPIKMDRNAETPVTRLGLILQTTETLQRLHHENVHMRYALGGPYIDDHMRSWRPEHGNGYHTQQLYQPSVYYQSSGYPDAYRSSVNTSSFHAYQYQDMWDRRINPASDQALHDETNAHTAATSQISIFGGASPHQPQSSHI